MIFIKEQFTLITNYLEFNTITEFSIKSDDVNHGDIYILFNVEKDIAGMIKLLSREDLSESYLDKLYKRYSDYFEHKFDERRVYGVIRLEEGRVLLPWEYINARLEIVRRLLEESLSSTQFEYVTSTFNINNYGTNFDSFYMFQYVYKLKDTGNITQSNIFKYFSTQLYIL